VAKLRRLGEASDLLLRHAVGWPSRRHLLGCYAGLGAAVTDPTEIELELRSGRSRVPWRMRRSDVFTLAEIFHDQPYRMHAALPAAPLVIDAGANIGLASLWLLGRYPGATIHAFEPEPGNFAFLARNLRFLTGARANQAALGDRDGETSLRIAAHGAMHSTTLPAADGGSIQVPLRRLDSYLAQQGIGSVDLLKLDVEGAELEVLRGLGDRIVDVGVIVGEVHERIVDVDSFYAHLGACGFSNVRRFPFHDGEAEGVHGFEASRGPPRT
jgi:FkbM family methyltransferase